MRLKLPILDVYAPIQVTLQTDKVVDIPCGTKARPHTSMVFRAITIAWLKQR